MKKTHKIFLFIFLLSFSVRIAVFFLHWPGVRHGLSSNYASVAVGLFTGEGMSYNKQEMAEIDKIKNNYSGNYIKLAKIKERSPLIYFLPGPAIFLYLLWQLIPIYNFLPNIIFFIFIDSLLISFFYLAFKNSVRRKILYPVIACLIINIPSIRVILTPSYDFWPVMCTTVHLIVIYKILDKKTWSSAPIIFFLLGLYSAIIPWFRETTLLLPFYFSILLLCFYKKFTFPFKRLLFSLTLYILPIVISTSALSLYHYSKTASYRPTRSALWTTFFAGVGQFSNPYNIKCSDISVQNFAINLNPKLNNLNSSDGLFDATLKVEALNFIKNHPVLFIRNAVYRFGIMISPFLYRDGTLIPQSIHSLLTPIGIFVLIVWLMGCFNLYLKNYTLFVISATIYFSFFSTIAWLCVSGQTIIPLLLVNYLMYFHGFVYLVEKSKNIFIIRKG